MKENENTDLMAFAKDWIDAWNAHDIERILSHYSDDAEMSSEYIRQMVREPSGKLVGKHQLREYWTEGLKRLPDLNFTHIATCIGVDSVAIHYQGGGGRLAIEVFNFDSSGLVNMAAAHYG